MKILRKSTSSRYQRDQITSYLLVSSLTCGAENLTITIVEMESGGFQHLHSHEPEQMYYILQGTGEITVDGETQEVKSGDCVFFASFAEHGLKNIGDEKLVYLSAASPSFTREQCKDLWPLDSLA